MSNIFTYNLGPQWQTTLELTVVIKPVPRWKLFLARLLAKVEKQKEEFRL